MRLEELLATLKMDFVNLHGFFQEYFDLELTDEITENDILARLKTSILYRIAIRYQRYQSFKRNNDPLHDGPLEIPRSSSNNLISRPNLEPLQVADDVKILVYYFNQLLKGLKQLNAYIDKVDIENINYSEFNISEENSYNLKTLLEEFNPFIINEKLRIFLFKIISPHEQPQLAISGYSRNIKKPDPNLLLLEKLIPQLNNIKIIRYEKGCHVDLESIFYALKKHYYIKNHQSNDNFFLYLKNGSLKETAEKIQEMIKNHMEKQQYFSCLDNLKYCYGDNNPELPPAIINYLDSQKYALPVNLGRKFICEVKRELSTYNFSTELTVEEQKKINDAYCNVYTRYQYMAEIQLREKNLQTEIISQSPQKKCSTSFEKLQELNKKAIEIIDADEPSTTIITRLKFHYGKLENMRLYRTGFGVSWARKVLDYILDNLGISHTTKDSFSIFESQSAYVARTNHNAINSFSMPPRLN